MKRCENYKQEQAQANVKIALTHLTANLLRISRGQGEPDRLVQELTDAIMAFRTYHTEFDELPSNSNLQEMLSHWQYQRPRTETKRRPPYTTPPRPPAEVADEVRRERADEVMMAALRLVAARMVEQNAQVGPASRELWQAIRNYRDA